MLGFLKSLGMQLAFDYGGDVVVQQRTRGGTLRRCPTVGVKFGEVRRFVVFNDHLLSQSRTRAGNCNNTREPKLDEPHSSSMAGILPPVKLAPWANKNCQTSQLAVASSLSD
jgi:hypothetical protein